MKPTIKVLALTKKIALQIPCRYGINAELHQKIMSRELVPICKVQCSMLNWRTGQTWALLVEIKPNEYEWICAFGAMTHIVGTTPQVILI